MEQISSIKNLLTHKKEINFDNEAFDILESVNPVYRSAIINMGIKLVSKTDFFKNYMEVNGLANTGNVSIPTTIDINNGVTQVVPTSPQGQTAQEAVVPKVTGWDDF